ncbi:MAG: heme biosynthesis HemY N-terminal domain-containing protein [Pseudomonadota bacterium]
MKALLWFLSLFALAAGISLLLRFNDAYLLLIFPPYRMELSLNFALILLAAAFLLFYGALRGLALTRALPAQVRAFQARRQREKTANSMHAALRSLFEGRFSQALKKAQEAYELARSSGMASGMAALLAARAAQRLGDADKTAQWLACVTQDDAQLQSAALMLEAEMLISARRFDEAVPVLRALQQRAGRHIAALRLELRAAQGRADWSEVLRIARLLEKSNALTPALAGEIKLKAHQHIIRQKRNDLAQLLAYMHALPRKERSVRLARALAEALLELGAHDELQSLLEEQLELEWDSLLVRFYGQSLCDHMSDMSAQISRLTTRIAWADRCLLAHPDDPELLLTLGRLCLAQRLWGKAQNYFEASLALKDRREIRLELARFFEQTERPEKAMLHYRAAAESLL